MDDMDISNTRHKNFLILLVNECDDRNMNMAEKADLDRTAVSRYKKGPVGGHGHTIGNAVAKRIETAFNKPMGWMDHLHIENKGTFEAEKAHFDIGGSYPILLPEQVKEFITTQQPPADAESVAEARPGLAGMRGFAIKELTDQFGITMPKNSVFHIFRMRIVLGTPASYGVLAKKLAAYFIDGHFVVGTVEIRPLGKLAITLPDTSTTEVDKSSLEFIGLIVRIELPVKISF